MLVGVEVDVGVGGTGVGVGEGDRVNVGGTDVRVGISGSETGDKLDPQLLVANAAKVMIRKTQKNLFISFGHGS